MEVLEIAKKKIDCCVDCGVSHHLRYYGGNRYCENCYDKVLEQNTCECCKRTILVEVVNISKIGIELKKLCAYCRYDITLKERIKKQIELKPKKVIPSKKPTPLTRQFIFQREFKKCGQKCFYCKNKLEFKDATIDHFRPKSKGGLNKGNRLFACGDCNVEKDNFSIDEFRDFLCLKLKRALKRNFDAGSEKEVERIRSAINTCSLILNHKTKPVLF